MNVMQIKHRARRLVRLAVLNGELARPERCENCRRDCKPQGAHYDYARPLDVRWLCPRCHLRWDRSEPKTPTAVVIAEPRELIAVRESRAGLRLREVAGLFDVHTSTVRAWVEARLIPAIKTPGGQYRIDPEDVERLLSEQAARPTVEPAEVAA